MAYPEKLFQQNLLNLLKMKNIQKSLLTLLLLFVFQITFSQITKEKALVKGECGMCKDRIEKTALKSGAKTATWTAETQTLEVEFDISKTSLDKLLKNIADVGHDNEKYKTDEDTYTALPECCHYDRAASFEEAIAAKNSEHTESSESHSEDHSEDHSQHTEKEKTIEGVKLTKYQEATALNKKEAGLVFNINSKELLKAACCNID